MKRLSALLLVFALIITNIPAAYASTEENTVRVESAEIDGELYTYESFFDSNGNTHVNISDEDGNTQVLVYSANNGTFYLDGEVVAVTRKLVTADGAGASVRAPSDWVYQGSSSEYVSWVKGTTVAVVAGVISVALGNIGGAAVIAAMGTAVLGGLAASAIGGTVHRSVYLCQTGATIQTRVDWYFTASTGERCPSSGTYTRFY